MEDSFRQLRHACVAREPMTYLPCLLFRQPSERLVPLGRMRSLLKPLGTILLRCTNCSGVHLMSSRDDGRLEHLKRLHGWSLDRFQAVCRVCNILGFMQLDKLIFEFQFIFLFLEQIGSKFICATNHLVETIFVFIFNFV